MILSAGWSLSLSAAVLTLGPSGGAPPYSPDRDPGKRGLARV